MAIGSPSPLNFDQPRVFRPRVRHHVYVSARRVRRARGVIDRDRFGIVQLAPPAAGDAGLTCALTDLEFGFAVPDAPTPRRDEFAVRPEALDAVVAPGRRHTRRRVASSTATPAGAESWPAALPALANDPLEDTTACSQALGGPAHRSPAHTPTCTPRTPRTVHPALRPATHGASTDHCSAICRSLLLHQPSSPNATVGVRGLFTASHTNLCANRRTV